MSMAIIEATVYIVGIVATNAIIIELCTKATPPIKKFLISSFMNSARTLEE